jgi:hypothetical protein
MYDIVKCIYITESWSREGNMTRSLENFGVDERITVAHPEFFIGGGRGADPEAIYNLCLILKIML